MHSRAWFCVWLMLCGLVPGSGVTVAAPAPAATCFEHQTDDGRPRHICIGAASYAADVCAAIERSATAWGLSPGYFARLIWQESHFRPNALSWAGAQGIAQFMPETGRLQGVDNAYDPAEALWRSARYLSKLVKKFGNPGLAAAAYNGGERRVANFVAGTGNLAIETIDYVRIVTGAPVTAWLAGNVSGGANPLEPAGAFRPACLRLANSGEQVPFTPPLKAVVTPWGVQVAQFFSAGAARAAFDRLKAQYPRVFREEQLVLVAHRNPNFGTALRYTAEVGFDTRSAAQQLCEALTKAGGACLVVRNP